MWAEGDVREGARWLPTLIELARQEFRIRYRAQALGVLWSFLQPIAMMGILSVVLARAFGVRGSEYPVYLLIGLIFWNFVSAAISNSVTSLVSKAEVIKRTMLPREIIPLSVMLSYVVNLGIETLALLAFIPFFPTAFHASAALVVLPAALAALLVLVSGIVLLSSSLNVIYRDVGYLATTGLVFLYWLTPIVYPLDSVPEPYRTILQLNPLTSILQGIRGAVMFGQFPTPFLWAAMFLPSLLVFVVGWAIFRRFERLVLDHV